MITFLVLAFWLFTAYLGLVRNTQVYRKQMLILNQVSDLAKQDIDQGRDWRWRYDEMRRVSYWEMVFHFWKPLDSWYENAIYLR